MCNVGRIKLGYYPLPQEEGKRLRKLLDFSAGTASVVDPCVGTGDALQQLTDGVEVEKHGVELDANRAATAAASGIRTIHGDLFNAIAKVESFSFLYLNPPYDSEIGLMGNKRMEFLFLEHDSLLWNSKDVRCDQSDERREGRFRGVIAAVNLKRAQGHGHCDVRTMDLDRPFL